MTTREGRGAGRAAYFSLLAATTLATFSSTIMSAPINEIAHGLGAGPQEIILAVSAFTAAMVVFAPFAGWLCDRLGPTTFLLGCMILMVFAQLGAAAAPNLLVMILMRGLQGIACSGIPPAVQQGLTCFWPDRRRQAMAAWASAIGIGQAVGPPAGGLVAELLGWRAVFGVQAGVCSIVVLLVHRNVPRVRNGHADLDVGGMTQLVAGAGCLVTGMTWAGQGAELWEAVPLIIVGLLVLAWSARPGRHGGHILGKGVARDPGYVVGTVAAAAGMAAMGITLVSVPLFLGREVGLSAGVIGATTFAVAAGMATFAPIASRIAARTGVARTLGGGLLLLILAPLGVGWLETTNQSSTVVVPLAALLFVVGCGIATVQSMAAYVLLGSRGARSGLALGVHNMGRFGGLAAGYAWVAGAYSLDAPVLVHAGSVAAAGVALLVGLLMRRGS